MPRRVFHCMRTDTGVLRDALQFLISDSFSNRTLHPRFIMIALFCIWIVLSDAHRHGSERNTPCTGSQTGPVAVGGFAPNLPAGQWLKSCSPVSFRGNVLCANCISDSSPSSSSGGRLSCLNVSRSDCVQPIYNLLGTLQCKPFPDGPWLSSCSNETFSKNLLCANCSSVVTEVPFQSCLNSSGCGGKEIINFNGALQCTDFPDGPWRDSCIPQTLEKGTLCAMCNNSVTDVLERSCIDTSTCSYFDSIYNFNGKLLCSALPGGDWRKSCFFNSITESVLCATCIVNSTQKSTCINYNFCSPDSIFADLSASLQCREYPPGPYLSSCTPQSFDGVDLCALCGSEATCIDTSTCVEPFVVLNVDGKLVCRRFSQ